MTIHKSAISSSRDAVSSRPTSLILAFAVSAVLMSAGDASAGCENYGTTVTLLGRVTPAVLAARAGQTDLRGDAGRTADLLVLDVPLCVSSDVVSAGVAAALTVQLACPGTTFAAGPALSVTGRLVGGHTGNGHTPILLACAP